MRSEPLKEYEERKKVEEEKKKEKEKAEEEKKKDTDKKDTDKKDADKKDADKKDMPDKPKEASVIAPLMPEMIMGKEPDGPNAPSAMMAGVVPSPPGKSDDKKPILPVTTWGRYMKVLLSSTEFMFIN